MISSPEKLSANHILDEFDCGQPALSEWLQRYALVNQQAGTSRTFVVCSKKRVIGFYSLVVGAVDHAAATARVAKGVARHPVPIMILARLGVDKRYKGQGIGKGLLKDALLRTVQAADLAGIRAILVHAKNEQAREFYEKVGFEPSPLDPLQLMLLMKDVRKAIK